VIALGKFALQACEQNFPAVIYIYNIMSQLVFFFEIDDRKLMKFLQLFVLCQL
jgi:hypothetical protein